MRAAWTALGLLTIASAAGGQAGLLGHSAGSRSEVLSSAFCRSFHCALSRTEQVAGPEGGMSSPNDVYRVIDHVGQTGELGVTHDPRTEHGTVNSAYLLLGLKQGLPPKVTPELTGIGAAFYTMVLGTGSDVRVQDVQLCLNRAFARLTAHPGGSVVTLGHSSDSRAFTCEVGPLKGHPGRYSVQFSADLL